jgi:UDP-N-acetylmuramate dehydrogenase
VRSEELKVIFEDVQGEKRLKESMRRYTSFHIGGAADFLIFPEGTDDLRKILYLCDKYKISLFVLGFGTNILVKDGGIRGVIVSLDKGFSEVRVVEGERVTAGAGAGLQTMVGFALKNELSGMEFAVGIPGSVGGALVMNAGTEVGEMEDIVQEVRIMTSDGEIRTLKKGDIKFSYRCSNFPSGSILLETDTLLKKGKGKNIKREMELFIHKRRLKQPLSFNSAGSVFKNPPGDFAGRLVESAGLKGFHVGDAMLSYVHANFIINRGNATARDVLRLIEIVKEEVFKKTGISLEEEIKIIGEDVENN